MRIQRLLLPLGMLLLLPIGIQDPAGAAERETTYQGESGIACPVAYARKNSLWLKDKQGDRQISNLRIIGQPQWSMDGKFLALVGRPPRQTSSSNHVHSLDPVQLSGRQNAGTVALEIINIENGSHKIVARYPKATTVKFAWSPQEDNLAFLRDGSLYVTNFSKGQAIWPAVTRGVNDFAWRPDGQAFAVAADAYRLPDGWTQARLYTIDIGKRDSSIQKNAALLYQLPRNLRTGGDLWITGVDGLKWSRDGKWLAFAAHSYQHTEDEGMLCALSSDASKFVTIGPTLPGKLWFAWSSSANTLAYIQGLGRDTAHGKKLTIAAAPRFVNKNLSPYGSVDNDFCWQDATHIVVSRRQESFLSQSPFQKQGAASLQFPALFNVDVERPSIQNRMTNPPKGMGDIQPQVAGWQQVIWLRTFGFQHAGQVWWGRVDGTEPQPVTQGLTDRYAAGVY